MDSTPIASRLGLTALSLLIAASGLSCASGPTSSSVSTDSADPRISTRSRSAIPAGQSLLIASNHRIPAGDYLRSPVGPEGRGGVIRIEGQSGVTLDLRGVSLRGTTETDRDAHTGYGIVISNCQDVTLRGGTIGGFKGCVVVEDSHDVVIEDMRFEDYYAQRLASTPHAEDLADWLKPHANDDGEWLESYGAAISLSDCSAVSVRNCRGRRGQNGILVTRSGGCEFYDNDFSFLSGWGLALYRSCRNVVSHNIFDYCVRGYSHDAYWRGQDSAGILMFERSSDNVVAYNSATHGGDGLFLFGGRDLVEGKGLERGEVDVGGCDRNLIYRNDFSFAVANSLETTFSRGNRVIANKLSGSHQHGVWGGYSDDLVVLGNEIADTLGGGVSIEHGRDCLIADNTFRNDDVGLELWWDEDEALLSGPYGEQNDASSRDHWIVDNVFEDNVQDLVVLRTTGVRLSGNSYRGENLEMDIENLGSAGDPPPEGVPVSRWLTGLGGTRPSGRIHGSTIARASQDDLAEYGRLDELRSFTPPEVPGEQVTSASERGVAVGLATIVMGTFGPWDAESGEPRPTNDAEGGQLGAIWNATWFRWEDDTDPRGDVTRWRALKYDPIARASVDAWTHPWGKDELRETIGSEYFGLIAYTELSIDEPGLHRLRVVSDDGVRVMVDGETVLEDWTWHALETDTIEFPLAAGTHRIELEYFQIDGASALSLDLERVAAD